MMSDTFTTIGAAAGGVVERLKPMNKEHDDMQTVEKVTPLAVRENGAIAPATEAGALIHMIERAARDPSVDIDKLKQLLELREKAEARAERRDFNNALAAAQSEMRPVAADAMNPQTKSKYASYAALDRALRPIYSRHNLSLSFNTGEGGPAEHVRVLCTVSRGGHEREYHIDMPSDGKGAKGGDVMTKTHATGSGVSYGMRYLLKMIFNIAVGDDDGNAAGSTDEYISEEQVAALTKLIKDTGGDVEKFCEFTKVEKLSNIYVGRYEAAVAAVKRAGDARKQKAQAS